MAGFLSGYDAALRAYKAGDIMKARQIVLQMDKSRPHYAEARKLLKRKIEPARKRLLRHYTAAALRAEQAGQWYQARFLYEQAAGFSTQPETLRNQARNMDVRMRQLRLERLIAVRRQDDEHLLSMLDQLDVPKGLSPKDEPFRRAREELENRILDRAREAWQAARRELHEGYPEVAYVEAESYRRLRPDDKRGESLMAQVRKALPKELKIPPLVSAEQKPAPHVRPPKTVTAKSIKQLMRKGDWLQAKRYALIYRREGGKNAERYLAVIEKKLKEEAARAFKAGRMAFQKEELDKAVKYWKRAVALQPHNAEYVQSLQRALLLQERLRILREESGKAAGGKTVASAGLVARNPASAAGPVSETSRTTGR